MLKISSDLSLPVEAVTQTFAILAKRGAGKSYTGCVLVEEMLSGGQQVVIADPIGVWWGLRSSADGKSPGFPIVVFGGEHGDLPLEEHSGEIVATSIVENGFSAVLDLSLFRKGAQIRFMTAFAERMYHLNRKPLHFMVDEADEFAPQRPMHGAERLLGAFEDIVRRGRARGLGVTLITQRAAVLNKNVLTQIEVLVVLRTISPQDRAAIEAWTEIHGTEKQLEQLSGTMASLPIGTAWFWSPGWLDIFKKIVVRRKTTFDSSATPKVGETAIKPKALAEINLDKLGAQIKATAETAKANDPAELKRQIAGLKKELAAKAKAVPAAAARTVEKIKTVQKFVLKDGQIDRLDKISQRILQLGGEIAEALREKRNRRPPLAISSAAPTPQRMQLPPRPAMPRLEPERSSQRDDPTNGALGVGERKILAALIHHPEGLKREQLTVLTGYKRSSRDTYLQRLRSRGLVDGDGEQIRATETGAAALPDVAPLPTGEALQEYYRGRLPQGELKILEVLIAAYPEPVDREVLSEQTQYLRSSRDTYLQRLRGRQLVVEHGRGLVRASEHLFS